MTLPLDLIGQSRMFYQYAAEIQGEGKSEDELVALNELAEAVGRAGWTGQDGFVGQVSLDVNR